MTPDAGNEPERTPIAVDHGLAAERLLEVWNASEIEPELPEELRTQIQAVHAAPDVAFKYILVTGLLGKLTNPQVHPRALQARSELEGAYDARSLCHRVIVPFEQSRGDLFGRSREPLVSKAARHPEHRGDNPQLRNRTLAATLHTTLEAARVANPDAVRAMLTLSLYLGRRRAGLRIVAEVPPDRNLLRTLTFVSRWIELGRGGASLVSVVAAFVRLLSDGVVRAYHPNASDATSRTAGDIEVFGEGGVRLAAYECKQRPLSPSDIRAGLDKAREAGGIEYVFVYSAGLETAVEEEIARLLDEAQPEYDVSVLAASQALPAWAATLNASRRARFGETVAEILRADMRSDALANEAASLWNSVE